MLNRDKTHFTSPIKYLFKNTFVLNNCEMTQNRFVNWLFICFVKRYFIIYHMFYNFHPTHILVFEKNLSNESYINFSTFLAFWLCINTDDQKLLLTFFFESITLWANFIRTWFWYSFLVSIQSYFQFLLIEI